MRSYAAVDHIEGNIAVCELENIETVDSKPDDLSKELFYDIMLDAEMLWLWWECLQDSDILVVEHDGENVTRVLMPFELHEFEHGEKERRLAYVASLMNG